MRRMFSTVLVANRGEVAIRIIQAVQELDCKVLLLDLHDAIGFGVEYIEWHART